MAAALWTAAGERTATPETGAAPLTTRWDAPWSAASGANSEANSVEGRARVLLYVRADSPTCLTLERAAGADAPLASAMDAFRPVVLDPDARAADRALVRRLGVTTAPRMLVMDGPTWAAWREAAAGSAPPPVRPLRPITGGHLEPFGLTLELARAAAEDPASWVPPAAPREGADPVIAVEWLEAAGALHAAEALVADGLATEPSPNGPFHRLDRLRAAARAHSVPGAADGEGPMEAALLREQDPGLLYRGWATLASVFEQRARAADGAPDGRHLGVEARRWDRRARECSRAAWLDCPDEFAPAFGALLIERYGAQPRDLDSLDRAFCGAVLRTLRGLAAADDPRLLRAAEVVAGLRR